MPPFYDLFPITIFLYEMDTSALLAVWRFERRLVYTVVYSVWFLSTDTAGKDMLGNV